MVSLKGLKFLEVFCTAFVIDLTHYFRSTLDKYAHIRAHQSESVFKMRQNLFYVLIIHY